MIATYITEAYLKDATALTDNIEGVRLATFIEQAQDLDIDPLIRPTYATTFKSAIEGTQNVAGVAATNPCEITTDGDHGWSTGQRVQISGSETITAINGGFTITVTGATTFTLDGLDGTLFAGFVPGTTAVLQMTDVLFDLLTRIKKPLAYFAFYRAVPFLWMQFKATGMVKQNGDVDGSQTASQSEMNAFRANIQTTANSYASPVLELLQCNPAIYPEWHRDCVDVTKPKTFKKWWSFGADTNRDLPQEFTNL